MTKLSSLAQNLLSSNIDLSGVNYNANFMNKIIAIVENKLTFSETQEKFLQVCQKK